MKHLSTMAIIAAVTAACGPRTPAEEPVAPVASVDAPGDFGVQLTQKLSADSLPPDLFFHVQVEGYGLIVVEMYTEDAPLNVANVANLAIEGFYDGLTFHRIVPGFVIQGGDPEGTGAGGLGYTVPAEISKTHEKGCMAMARKSDDVNPEKANSSCQFYFCLEAVHKLDGNYTVIGRIVEGLDVMEAIGALETGESDKPLSMVVIDRAWVTAR